MFQNTFQKMFQMFFYKLEELTYFRSIYTPWKKNRKPIKVLCKNTSTIVFVSDVSNTTGTILIIWNIILWTLLVALELEPTKMGIWPWRVDKT